MDACQPHTHIHIHSLVLNYTNMAPSRKTATLQHHSNRPHVWVPTHLVCCHCEGRESLRVWQQWVSTSSQQQPHNLRTIPLQERARGGGGYTPEGRAEERQQQQQQVLQVCFMAVPGRNTWFLCTLHCLAVPPKPPTLAHTAGRR